MTTREAFKFGFCVGCLDAGLSVKKAWNPLDSASAALGGAFNAAKTLAPTAILAALAAPPIAGGTVGYMAGKATDDDDTDVENAKTDDLIAELRRNAAHLNRVKALRQKGLVR